uniref:Uncharacterized protein n=1 Tax=Anopheles maculatus TaxID=74869 RepID=A0A182TAV7_9DIPT
MTFKLCKVYRTHQQHDPTEQSEQIVPVGQVGHRNKLKKPFQLTEITKHLRTFEVRSIEPIDRVHGPFESVPHKGHVQQWLQQHAGIAQRYEEPGEQRCRHHYQDAHEDGVLHRHDAAQQQSQHLRNPAKHEAN